ncbi:MAG: methyltransferase domain-containing protein [Actinobacteria bacterium]|nr:methyltransferase domain-containing protein [Actinomycetota bacterium]
MPTPVRPPNDRRQYDDLAGEWWKPDGEFAALHWLAAARARLVPPPRHPGALLVDVGCGGGVLAPHLSGYHHVGVDLTLSALRLAHSHGVVPVGADATRLPFADGAAQVVVAGELFEHVADVEAVCGEISRILGPGGSVVFDTINNTRWARLSLVTIGERMPGGPPRNIHDPALFVVPERVVDAFASHGVRVSLSGLRPSGVDYLRFLVDRSRTVRMLPTGSLAGVYQGVGRKW